MSSSSDGIDQSSVMATPNDSTDNGSLDANIRRVRRFEETREGFTHLMKIRSLIESRPQITVLLMDRADALDLKSSAQHFRNGKAGYMAMEHYGINKTIVVYGNSQQDWEEILRVVEVRVRSRRLLTSTASANDPAGNITHSASSKPGTEGASDGSAHSSVNPPQAGADAGPATTVVSTIIILAALWVCHGDPLGSVFKLFSFMFTCGLFLCKLLAHTAIRALDWVTPSQIVMDCKLAIRALSLRANAKLHVAMQCAIDVAMNWLEKYRDDSAATDVAMAL